MCGRCFRQSACPPSSSTTPTTHLSRLVVRLRFDLVKGLAATFDLRDDVVGAGFPYERFGIEIPVLGPLGDGGAEFGDAGERAATQAFIGEFFEPALDQVQPGARGGREMQ